MLKTDKCRGYRCRKHSFTLTELLAVMAIIAILMGIALTPFQNVLSSSGVDGAQRMVTSQLRMARQYAISKREKVAVLMPGPNTSVPDQMRYTAFRSCIVKNGDEFKKWIENTEWNYVPTGSSIIQVLDSPPSDSPVSGEYDSTTGWSDTFEDIQKVNYDWNNDGTASEKRVDRAVVFEPTGRLSHTGVYVTACEAVYKSGNKTVRNGNNWISMKVNQFTGRVEVIRPSD